MPLEFFYGLNAATIAVCLFGAFLLFVRSEGIRARKVLGGVFLVWAMVYLFGFGRIEQIDRLNERGIMPLFAAVCGVLGSCTLLFYVLEVLRPGWLSLKRFVIIMTPYLFAIILLATVLLLGKEPVRTLGSFTEFVRYFSEFNVWIRLVFVGIIIEQITAMFIVFFKYASGYQKWTQDSYSTTDRMEISWFRYLLAGVVFVVLIYFVALCVNSPLPLCIHYLIIIIFYSYLTYKGLFQENPYAENCFRNSLTVNECDGLEHDSYESGISSYPAKMLEYHKAFEQWMNDDKPFLRTDFKLADLQSYLPMNRTYLARFFSDFYGCSFNHVVRRFRVNEAERIMQQNPYFVSKEVYPLSGFTSEVVFHRTFMEVTGITPKQYRDRLKRGDKPY